VGPKVLAEILKGLPKSEHPDLLVGFNAADDAGVFKLNDKQALVQTVDFFPPIVDDPYQFGQIAAANALSDVYAMGGKPLTALNIVGFPPKMDPAVMTEILKGGQDKINEAGAAVVGGHTVKDNELKYGLSVTGIIDIDKIITNSGAREGDVLLLTKPLGTGIITTAIKQGKATPEDTEEVIAVMARLNKRASELMQVHIAHAATDITGFGILGHAYEMAQGSGVTFEIAYNKLPMLSNVIRYAEMGAITGGANANEEYLKDKIKLPKGMDRPETDILFDAQTSGGLLIALMPEDAEKLIADASAEGLEIAQIGRVVKKGERAIVVI